MVENCFRVDHLEYADFHREHRLVITILMAYKYNDHLPLVRRIWGSKFIILIFFILLILVGLAIYREKSGQKRAVKSVSALEEEISKLESKNTELSELINYLKSDDFVEKEAREKLNMQRPGEQVVLISKNETERTEINGVSDVQEKKNWQLWLEYFFGG